MVDSAHAKNWWESELDWNLNASLADTMRLGRWLRNIPSTMSAYRLGKESPVDQIAPDPVERIGNLPPMAVAGLGERTSHGPSEQPRGGVDTRPASADNKADAGPTRAVNMPAVIEPQQQAIDEVLALLEAEEKKAICEELATSNNEPAPKRELTKVEKIVEERHLTLEQLLDPNFCDYT